MGENVRAFQGIRFSTPVLDTVLAPPYDVVTAERQRDLIERDKHNVLRVDNPAIEAGSEEANVESYAQAATLFESWLADGALVQDAEPSLYVVEHEFPNAQNPTARSSRLGVIALLPAVAWSEGTVRPHEHTFAGPKQDRLDLMRSTGAQTSPIFAMWDSAPGIAEVVSAARKSAPTATAQFDGEIGKESLKLWRVAGSDAARVLSCFDRSTFYIADGHHRFETAVAFAQERVAKSGGRPSVLAYLADSQDPGLCLLPTHRLVKLPPATRIAVPELCASLGAGWACSELGHGVNMMDALYSESENSRHRFAVVSIDGLWLLSKPREVAASPQKGLDVQVLHDEVLPALGASHIEFERDAERAKAAVREGRADLAFIMAPPSIQDVLAVADAGETMPQKSTYFYPKVPTGLVLYRP